MNEDSINIIAIFAIPALLVTVFFTGISLGKIDTKHEFITGKCVLTNQEVFCR